jgi:hypothetical protein
MKLSFKEGRDNTISMVVEVGEVESRNCLGETRSIGKGLETLMPQETRHQFKLGYRKGKNAKEAIGWAWSKWFHVSRITGRNADNPYFISAVKQTQQWDM